MLDQILNGFHSLLVAGTFGTLMFAACLVWGVARGKM
jgi:hypothetical protein